MTGFCEFGSCSYFKQSVQLACPYITLISSIHFLSASLKGLFPLSLLIRCYRVIFLEYITDYPPSCFQTFSGSLLSMEYNALIWHSGSVDPYSILPLQFSHLHFLVHCQDELSSQIMFLAFLLLCLCSSSFFCLGICLSITPNNYILKYFCLPTPLSFSLSFLNSELYPSFKVQLSCLILHEPQYQASSLMVRIREPRHGWFPFIFHSLVYVMEYIPLPQLLSI